MLFLPLVVIAILFAFCSKKAIGEGGFEITDITKSGQKISSLKDKSTIVDSINSNPLPSQSQKENLIQNGEV
ncbi:MAG: hypothetical protein RSA20_01790, partial [Oscillospiraceae bacterium]